MRYPLDFVGLQGMENSLISRSPSLSFCCAVFSTAPTSFSAIGKVSDPAMTIVQTQLSGERNAPG